MAIDVPIINYGSENKYEEPDHSKEEMDGLSDAWFKIRKGQSFAGKKLTVSDIFNG